MSVSRKFNIPIKYFIYIGIGLAVLISGVMLFVNYNGVLFVDDNQMKFADNEQKKLTLQVESRGEEDDHGGTCKGYIFSPILLWENRNTVPDGLHSYITPVNNGTKNNWEGEYTVHFELYKDGPKFDIFYDFNEYDAHLQIHNECDVLEDGFDEYQEIAVLSANISGKDGILFTVDTQLKETGGHDKWNEGYITVKGPGTGFWLSIRGTNYAPDPVMPVERVNFKIADKTGNLALDGGPTAFPGFLPGKYPVQVCTITGTRADTMVIKELDNFCITDVVNINTKTAPYVSCMFDEDLRSLKCKTTQKLDYVWQ